MGETSTEGAAVLMDAFRDFYADYAFCLDDDHLEAWPDFFTETAVYKIIPRENMVHDLPLAVWYCDGKGMLRDRVTSLRHANIYDIHTTRHLITNIRRTGEKSGVHEMRASYASYHTDQEGVTVPYSVGTYLDRIIIENGAPKFAEKIVVVDSFAFHNLLATPL